ncbi:glycosyltransferase family 4 protein [Aidingimonas halophila]|uniref:UDP-glucose:(Heptosyl)LPS alpha-1,3-glucosyltransferase n=1 Tax=Aidingimonas halophila TaxID=574349 RepID=A0A1H3G882_9GAMM|nr:glycosyltransferase family 4 protein [Aidingimonas halophila]SDX99250.1 UDP-glucose:(heptosyl)LPS alpha-1,3-glucosyltransferase [Aidingimonas halophila]
MTSTNAAPLAAIAIRQVEKRTGASRNAFEQTAALRELGYRVVILAERGNRQLIEQSGADWVRLWRWPFKGPQRRFWFDRRVQAWCRRHTPALLISHGDCVTNDVVYMHNCVHLASQRIHGRDQATGEVAAIHDHVLSQNRGQRIAVNSRLMGDDLASRYNISRARIDISYPGYDPAQFNPERARSDRRSMRESLGIEEATRLIGLVTSGNFRKRNVAGFVSMAAELLSKSDHDHRFLVVGKDDASPYQQQAEQLGIADRFLWRSTIPEVERLYGALDLFVLPAHIEEFGRVVLEAMACGTPVLLSHWVGAAELLESDFEELIVESDQPTEWAERIVSIMERDDYHELAAGLAQLANHYSHEQQYEKLKDAFRLLCKDT